MRPGGQGLRPGGKGLRYWSGLADCANAVEDEIFEEEESAESEGGLARRAPFCEGGGGLSKTPAAMHRRPHFGYLRAVLELSEEDAPT